MVKSLLRQLHYYILLLWIFLTSKVYFNRTFGRAFTTLVTVKGSNYDLSFTLMWIQWTPLNQPYHFRNQHTVCTTWSSAVIKSSVIKNIRHFIPTEMRSRSCVYIKSYKLLICSSWFWKFLGNCCCLGTWHVCPFYSLTSLFCLILEEMCSYCPRLRFWLQQQSLAGRRL